MIETITLVIIYGEMWRKVKLIQRRETHHFFDRILITIVMCKTAEKVFCHTARNQQLTSSPSICVTKAGRFSNEIIDRTHC